MNWKYVAISVVLAVIITSVFHILKKGTYKKLNILLATQDYKSFNQFINSNYCKFFISKVENLNYRLNSSFLRNNRKDIDEAFNALEKEKMPIKFKQQLYMQGLNYYISIEDKNRALNFLNKINELKNEQLKLEANIIYDVYIAKGEKYLDLLLNRITMQDAMFSGVDEFLISLIYKNKKDYQKAQEYEARSKKHLAMLDEHLKNKKA